MIAHVLKPLRKMKQRENDYDIVRQIRRKERARAREGNGAGQHNLPASLRRLTALNMAGTGLTPVLILRNRSRAEKP